ncbi:MAG: hypothetical protein RL420_1518 [Pseudomonadota bacterium]
MHKRLFNRKAMVSLAVCLWLTACGGGGSNDATIKSSGPGSIFLTGTAAIGAPIANQTLAVKCGSLVSPFYVSGETTTAANGSFSIGLANAQFPCLLQVNSSGVLLHAISNLNGVANVTPLTEALVAAVLNHTDPAALFATFNYSTVQQLQGQANASSISAAWEKLKEVLVSRGISVTSISTEPTTTTLSAAFNGTVGNEYDQLLDKIKELNLTKGELFLMATGKSPTGLSLNNGITFNFIKLDSKGVQLTTQSGTWSDSGTEAAGTKWDCVKDTTTGLYWEVKRNEVTHPRYKGHTYTWFSNTSLWYHPDSKAYEKTSYWYDPVLKKDVDITDTLILNGGVVGVENSGNSARCTGVTDTSQCNTSSYVDSVNSTKLCGFSDWELPDADALQSLIKHDVAAPMVSEYFPNTMFYLPTDIAYWTKTPSANSNSGNFAFHVSFGTGKVEDGLKSSARPALLVRGAVVPAITKENLLACNTKIEATRPNSRYAVLSGEVTDNVTGLIWKQCEVGRTGATCSQGVSAPLTFSQAQAVAFSASKTTPAWRLPTRNELTSIVERKCSSPSINSTIFPGQPSSGVWSATTNKEYPDAQWIVNFYNGFVTFVNASTTQHVRLVRNP